MLTLAKRLWTEEEGQGMVEYGLILGLIAVAAIALLSGIGGKIRDVFQKVDTQLGDVLTEGEG